MKKLLKITLLFLFPIGIYAQNIEVIGTAKITQMDIENDVDSIVVKMPDGTLAIRDAATLSGLPANPSTGQILYFNGTIWVTLSPGTDGQVLALKGGLPIWADNPLSIGDIYEGGIVFYLAYPPSDLNGDGKVDRGLVAAQSDQSINAQWGCSETDLPNVPNVTAGPSGPGADIGDGRTNTDSIIINSCILTAHAAKKCVDLMVNDYHDWYLPSILELIEMHTNLHLANLGDFASASYWSSTEYNDLNAWSQSFTTGNLNNVNKTANYHVRAIRVF